MHLHAARIKFTHLSILNTYIQRETSIIYPAPSCRVMHVAYKDRLCLQSVNTRTSLEFLARTIMYLSLISNPFFIAPFSLSSNVDGSGRFLLNTIGFVYVQGVIRTGWNWLTALLYFKFYGADTGMKRDLFPEENLHAKLEEQREHKSNKSSKWLLGQQWTSVANSIWIGARVAYIDTLTTSGKAEYSR